MATKKIAVSDQTAAKVVPSAPPLPAAIAKKYGLHEHVAPDAPPSPVRSASDAVLEDVQTDMAIEDIQAQESDAVLAAEDAAQRPPVTLPKKGFWHRIGRFFAAWWHNKWARYTTIAVLLLGMAAGTAIPTSRYFVLNTAGVRSSASVIVMDNATSLPLKNVKVTLNGRQAMTDVRGIARFNNLELGPTELRIKRVAFAPYDLAVTIGWGSNPLGTYKLQATGVQYVVQVTDYLSGKPVPNVEASSDEAQAISDKNGKVTLTVEDTEAVTLPVTISGKEYRSESLVLDAEDEAPAKVALVPVQKHVYINKQSGKPDVHAVDIDGKNTKLLLPGTGLETSNISLATSANGEQAALVSTRDNVRDKDGFLMTSLTLIDVGSGSTVHVDHGAQIQLVGWMGKRLIYRIAMPGASAANAQRYRLIAYNYETNAKLQLTSANLFTVSQATRDYVYYAASSNDPKAQPGLFRIKPDGSGKQRVFDKEVWTAVRTAYDIIALQTPDTWYSYTLSVATASEAAAPALLTTQAYVNDSQDERSVLLGKQGDRNALLLYDINRNKTTTLTTQDGLGQPVHWAGDKAIIYRVANGGETADYAISPQGGSPRKIADVTVSYGIAAE